MGPEKSVGRSLERQSTAKRRRHLFGAQLGTLIWRTTWNTYLAHNTYLEYYTYLEHNCALYLEHNSDYGTIFPQPTHQVEPKEL